MNSPVFNHRHVNITINQSTATIHVGEFFNFDSHAEFNGAYYKLLADSSIKTLEVDLGAIQHFDSSALGMLLLLRERAEKEGKSLLLVRPNQLAMRALDLANFNKIFTIH